jgi:hypothetical protein
LPLPATSAHRASHPLDGLTPPLVCSALFHAEYAHGIPSHSLSAPAACLDKLPREWGAPCGTPHLGFRRGCLGRSVLRRSLSRASRVCTPHRPPTSPGFPVNIITTSLNSGHRLDGELPKLVARPLTQPSLPWSCLRRKSGITDGLVHVAPRQTVMSAAPEASRSFSKPSATLLSWFVTPEGCPPGTTHLESHATSGHRGCPRDPGYRTPAQKPQSIRPSGASHRPLLRDSWSCPHKPCRSSFCSTS